MKLLLLTVGSKLSKLMLKSVFLNFVDVLNSTNRVEVCQYMCERIIIMDNVRIIAEMCHSVLHASMPYQTSFRNQAI